MLNSNANGLTGFISYNYGLISNIKINLTSDNYNGNRNTTTTLLANNNYGTIENFEIILENEINMPKNFATIWTNYGTIKNGYICGNDLNSDVPLESGVYKDIGVLCYRNGKNGEIKNIFSNINLQLAEGNYTKNATTLISINDAATVKNIYSTGDIINSNKNLRNKCNKEREQWKYNRKFILYVNRYI